LAIPDFLPLQGTVTLGPPLSAKARRARLDDVQLRRFSGNIVDRMLEALCGE
jgi:hypothetical protein